MHIYLAGTSVSNPEQQPDMLDLFKQGKKLHSYFHCVDGFEQSWFQANLEAGVDLFLDSGAFSAWSQGVLVDIEEYISFIEHHERALDIYANLDVIAVNKNTRPNKESAELTLNNQKIMEDAGLEPMPVFHMGEPEDYLHYYVENYDYIGLGGLARTANLYTYLDRVFGNIICDNRGKPKVKIHGFAMTSLKLMLRYPWYSVDSTSWVVAGRLGGIYVPRQVGGEWVYDENPWKISVSSRSPGKKDDKQHIDNLTPRQKSIIMRYINDKGYSLGRSTFRKQAQDYSLAENEKWAGKKPKDKQAKRLVETIEEPGLSNMYQLRDEFNIIYYLDLDKAIPKWPWNFKNRKPNALL